MRTPRSGNGAQRDRNRPEPRRAVDPECIRAVRRRFFTNYVDLSVLLYLEAVPKLRFLEQLLTPFSKSFHFKIFYGYMFHIFIIELFRNFSF
jgi:hypothetical protein